jgi:hypothetical protein
MQWSYFLFFRHFAVYLLGYTPVRTIEINITGTLPPTGNSKPNHSRTQSPSYARSTERDEGLWPNPYQTGIWLATVLIPDIVLLPCFYGIRLWIWPEPLVSLGRTRVRRALGTRMKPNLKTSPSLFTHGKSAQSLNHDINTHVWGSRFGLIGKLTRLRSACLLLTHIKFNLYSYVKRVSPVGRDLTLR